MEEFVEGLMAKVGISEEQAKGVIEFLRENADKVPALLKDSGLAAKLPGALGGLFD